MKNLTKRNRILLGIGGVLVVAVVAVVVFAQVSGVGLFGSAIWGKIIPENPTIKVGQTITLQLDNGNLCQWGYDKDTLPDAVLLTWGDDETAPCGWVDSGGGSHGSRTCDILGRWPGTQILRARCGAPTYVNVHKTTVTVVP